MKKYYVEISAIVEAWSEEQAEAVGDKMAQTMIGHELTREAWVNNVWEEENTQG
jgi:hypothetical protein